MDYQINHKLTWLKLTLAVMITCIWGTVWSESKGYKLAPEDVLIVSVWKEDGLTQEVLVRPDGGMSFPLVGYVQAEGRTPEEVQVEIKEKLKKYIPEPVVTVSVKSVVGNKIFVIGKVARPGVFAVGRHIDVLQALTLAGGLTPFAAQNKIKIIRRENGKLRVFKFRYAEVAAGKQLSQNILLKGGDTVIVN